MFKASWKYALICGSFLIILFHVSSAFGLNPLINIGHLIFDILIFGLFIFFAVKEFKSYVAKGILHFWQGMTIGFLVYILATLLFTISLVIYFSMDESALGSYQREAIAFLDSRAEIYKEQFGEDGFSKQITGIQNVTISDLIVSSTVKKLIAGFFITPVISILLRKQPRQH